ncbi:MAG: lytic murein transglycosylase B, partial [Gammaproteobacteria bacterium]|nr:lytic murein transglycosylase B [Gammaproteobacteria bacterium]
LTTLAFDYPRRSAFFKGELTQFLLLVREEGKDPFEPVGSYAGAMGYGQFISSSYRNYAVDFDGDNRRDIWTNKTDAIGSVANYFARHGWKGQGPPAVRLDDRIDRELELADTGLDLEHLVGELRRLGAVVPEAIGDAERAALFTMELAEGKEYWLARHDFYVITRYNRSALYALAVLQLSEAVRSGHEDASRQ